MYLLVTIIALMPVIPHISCQEPTPDTVICRFIDFDKFRDLFANEELYFRRDDLFKEIDPEEALAPDDYIRASEGLVKYDLRDELKLNASQAFSREISEARYIQCWHIYEEETLHMWARYGGGVAIFSRFDLLKAALNAMLDDITVGLVRYGNIPDRYNLIDFLFLKRKHFEKERELRVVISSYDPVGSANRHIDHNGFPHREPLDKENPLHKWVHEYKRRRIDLKALVTEIRLSPWVTTSEINEVNDWLKGKSFSCPVKHSELEGPVTPSLEEYRRLGNL
jgi:hypothetical protein